MGFLVGMTCFASQAEAVAAHYAAAGETFVPTGLYQYVISYVPASSVGHTSPSGFARLQTRYVLASGAVDQVLIEDLPMPYLVECDASLAFADGMAVGWGIAAAVVAVAAIKMMQRAR